MEAVQSGGPWGERAQALGLSLKEESLVQEFLFKPSSNMESRKGTPSPTCDCHGEPQGLPSVGSQPRLISGRGARCTLPSAFTHPHETGLK